MSSPCEGERGKADDLVAGRCDCRFDAARVWVMVGLGLLIDGYRYQGADGRVA